jgi:hypothetical protein
LATSTDGHTWNHPDRPIAFALSSLNLLITEQGVLITGVVDRRVFDRMGLDLPEMDELYALVSEDLQTWGSHAWTLDDAESRQVIDPGFWLDEADGLHAAWYGTTYDGDPAQAPGAHSIRGATWNGQGFDVQADDLIAEENLADPSLCRMGTEEWMFLTESSQRVRAARSSDGQHFAEDPTFSWEGVTVPWCRSEEEHLVLYGQTGGGNGSPASEQVNPDGSTVILPPPYDSRPFDGNDCTALAVGQYQGTWLMVCAASYTG